MTTGKEGKMIVSELQQIVNSDVDQGERIMAEEIKIDNMFKWVRYGLSITMTVFLLSAFALVYLRPGDASYYICWMVIALDVAVFGAIVCAALRGRTRYATIERKRADAGKSKV